MDKNHNDKLNKTIELFKKAAQNPDTVTNTEKKQIKKLINGDESLIIEALQSIMTEQEPYYPANKKLSPLRDGERTPEEIVADNYVALAKFAIEKMNLKNAHKLKVRESEYGFTIYALTPEPVELDFEQFATSDYPDNKELLLEAEALQSDLFMEDSTEKYRLEIIRRIENSILSI